MEQDGEEGATYGIAKNVELFKNKGFNFPLKPEGQILVESPITYESERGNWPVNDLSGFAPPCPSTSSINVMENGVQVEELTVENYKTSSLSLAKYSSNLRQSQWRRMYRLETRLEHEDFDGIPDHLLFRAKEQLARMSCENHKSKDTDETPRGISLRLKSTDSMNRSKNTLSVAANRLKTLSRPSFPQLLVKKGLKGKGIVRRDPEICTTAQNDQPCSLEVDKSAIEPCDDGISLREWLKSERRKEQKAESLNLFKQIVELVDSAHSQGVVLQDLRPSCFYLLSPNRVKYTGLSSKEELASVVGSDLRRKRSLEHGMNATNCKIDAKQLKLNENMHSPGLQAEFSPPRVSRAGMRSNAGFHASIKQGSHSFLNQPAVSCYPTTAVMQSVSVAIQPEERWYASPEELSERSCSFSSNIYSLGVFLFELLCHFESWEKHSAVMLDLSQRILPPNFLSEHLKEAGFCLWLLHPEPLSRPTTREILQSDLFFGSQERSGEKNLSEYSDGDVAESEILVHFLNELEEQKQNQASKLIEEIRFLEEDIKEAERRHLLRTSSVFPQVNDAEKKWLPFEEPGNSVAHYQSHLKLDENEGWLSKNIRQLEHAYFSMRSQIRPSEAAPTACSDKNLPKNGDNLSNMQSVNGELRSNQKSSDPLGAFFEGLCKFACYSKFEVCGTVRNRDLLNSSNVICTLSFDRDEDYIATAGISKRIKVFEFDAFMNDSVDIHYPVVEMVNKSKLSCVCWNNYIKNYLASTDYDGVVQIWDAGTGQGLCQYTEHQKRAWSVDFSQADPTKFASGSDDCCVKLWSINDRSSIGTIFSHANVCCVQFSTFSPHQLALGSADYKVYCYDLRYAKVPLCTLADHEKTVSYVKFLDSQTLVSASTDNTLKLWDLNKTSSDRLSSSCDLTFRGHKNEKNFVGLSVLDGYVACGSETNEVYCYYKSLPMPITSYKFGFFDPTSCNQIIDESAQFVSSVCWRQKSSMLVAANSTGSIKLLKLV